MNKYFISPLLAIIAFLLTATSCLTHGLEPLDTYDGSDIESFHSVSFRKLGPNTLPNGELKVKDYDLKLTEQKIDKESKSASVNVALPSNFPTQEIDPNEVKLSELVVRLNISTAATLEPLSDAPALGKPGDWSKPHQYLITAADGSTSRWTVTLRFVK